MMMNTNNNKENKFETIQDYVSPLNNMRMFNMENIPSEIKN